MAGPDADPPRRSTGPPDRETLQLLERQLSADPLVSTTAFEPDVYEPRTLVADLDSSRYPPAVTAARLDVRWFESGDFSCHYLETHGTESNWECRWDRHPNGHDDRTHFHQPPDGATVVDLDLPSVHPLDVYATVLTAIETRIDETWDS
ncbi:hypothetical protein Halru_0237 [Halovivax ruber XH-70]|uniref:Uncharacterized protein n=1 Tax=Halovivax ruber (strain DSM 18193 / JCM 13892 / XH-70) TaxID=797302 RepID=L0I7X3_HALRX|nr:hypothetical protein [Halovivax ruber]AGB14883.1 hypothetical protein Halru_0237 [Halovivax ruber XH-70]